MAVLHNNVEPVFLSIHITFVIPNNVFIRLEVLKNIAEFRKAGVQWSARAKRKIWDSERCDIHLLAELLKISLVHSTIVEFLQMATIDILVSPTLIANNCQG